MLLSLLAKRHVRVEHVVEQVLLSACSVHRRQEVYSLLLHVLIINTVLLLLPWMRGILWQLFVQKLPRQSFYPTLPDRVGPLRSKIGQVPYNWLTLPMKLVVGVVSIFLSLWVLK